LTTDERFFVPEGTRVLSGPIGIIPTRLLFALCLLFEKLECVSYACVVQGKFNRPNAEDERAHLVVEVVMVESHPKRFIDILPDIEQVVKRNYAYDPDRPVDVLEVGKNGPFKAPLKGSQLFFQFPLLDKPVGTS
jgi:hypothetical protein